MALERPSLILLIDDDEDMRDLLSDALTRRGFDVLCLEDGRAALRYLAALMAGVPSVVRPRVIVSDVNMPGATGIDLLEEVAAIRPSIPVVLITGFADHAVRSEAARLGAAAFIEKPLDVSALIHVVTRLLGERAA